MADSLLCNWFNLYELSERGVAVVGRLNKAHRKADFRKGTRLGPDDHVVQWPRPQMRNVKGAACSTMPDSLSVRELRFRVAQAGFRSREIIVVTTLLDPVEYPKEDLTELYRARWNQELNLRSIKTTMQMDVCRCKTPDLVRKEVWTQLLAYNLIRTVMAQAAEKHDLQPRSISFKGTMQTLEMLQPLIVFRGRSRADRESLYQELLNMIVVHRVANRPGRFEPRKKKRRRMPYDLLTKPRAEAKLDIIKGLSKN
ncbi:MAG: hypothetical protein Aurels2KO_54600 [Aureliella sp.]